MYADRIEGQFAWKYKYAYFGDTYCMREITLRLHFLKNALLFTNCCCPPSTRMRVAPIGRFFAVSTAWGRTSHRTNLTTIQVQVQQQKRTYLYIANCKLQVLSMIISICDIHHHHELSAVVCVMIGWLIDWLIDWLLLIDWLIQPVFLWLIHWHAGGLASLVY